MLIDENPGKTTLSVYIPKDEHFNFMKSLNGFWYTKKGFWGIPKYSRDKLMEYLKTLNLLEDLPNPTQQVTQQPEEIINNVVEPSHQPEAVSTEVIENIKFEPRQSETASTEVIENISCDSQAHTQPPKKRRGRIPKNKTLDIAAVPETDNSKLLAERENEERRLIEERRVLEEKLRQEREERRILEEKLLKEREERRLLEEKEQLDEMEERRLIEERELIEDYHPRKIVDLRKRTTHKVRQEFIQNYVNSDDEEETEEGKEIYEKFKNLFKFYRVYSDEPTPIYDFSSKLSKLKQKLRIS